MISFRRTHTINRFLHNSRCLQKTLIPSSTDPQTLPTALLSLRRPPPLDCRPLNPSPALKMCRRGNELLDSQLSCLLDNAIKSTPNVELAVLHLIRHYQFDFENLTDKLVERGLNPSFSKVTYRDVAANMGLDPDADFRDAPTFDPDRARIPTPLFKQIIEDMHLALNQYGTPIEHHTEEARSRFIAPLMNRLVAQFRLLIKNTPESLMLGRVATKGRIEYQFKVYGTLTLLFVEVKLRTGTFDDYLNAIAQVFAEADACDLINSKHHFNSPIYAVLCDGQQFDFFIFNDYVDLLKLSRGVFPRLDGSKSPTILLPRYEKAERLAFIKALRPICEYFYSILLRGYIAGIQHYYTRSQKISVKDERFKESAPAWAKAVALGEEALKKGLEAAEMAKEVGMKEKANELATEGLEALKCSVNSTPPPYNRDDCNLMEVWDDSL